MRGLRLIVLFLAAIFSAVCWWAVIHLAYLAIQ